jgi:putative ABC transport system permease protein
VINDLRQAIRALSRHPAFTGVAVLTLALGIGANTALFSVADAVLLRPLPYPEPERLAWIEGAPFRDGQASFAGLARQFHESPLFENGGLYATGALNVGGEEVAERVRAAVVTAGFLPTLGVQPAAGRVFVEEEVVAAERVAVLGHAFARRRGLEPGATLALNGRAFTVIGVMPPRVDFPGTSDLWIPMGSDRQITGRALAPRTIARLAPGVSAGQAVTELDRIDVERRGAPRDPRQRAPSVVPLTEFLVGPVRPLFLAVLGAVLLVLLVACINTANLLLARVASREREMSVRRALGASRLRLARHLVVESALLSLLAGIAALPIAFWTLGAITPLLPAGLHNAGAIGLDLRAIAATAALSIVATILFGFAPAWSLRRAGAAHLLRGASSATTDPFWRHVRAGLVVAEIAIALVLVAGAATIANTVNGLMRVDLGVTGERVLTMETTLPLARYDSAERVAAFHEQLQAAIGALPAVEAVGATSAFPGSREVGVAWRLAIDGLPAPQGAESFVMGISVTPGYFRAIGLDVVAGRPFNQGDHQHAPRVAIVSERVARVLGLDPHDLLGRPVQGGRQTQAIIVGIVRDVLMGGPGQSTPMMLLYEPMAQSPGYGTTFIAVKSSTPPAGQAAAVRTTMAGIDPDVPLYNVRTFDEVRAAFIADRRFAMTMMGGFGLLATLLAGIGLYGVLTYLVQLRTREIGIRMALGASPFAVRWQVVRSGLAHGVAGLTLGAAAAYAASQFLVSRIPGIEPAGATLVAGAAASLLVLCAVVTWLPARRATSINPVLALRAEE